MSSTRFSLVMASSPAQWSEAERLVKEYAASLCIDLGFQSFAHELEHLEEVYGPPTGAFLLESSSLGCCGLRRFEEGVAEMKRLYVAPAARGRGLGEALARRVIDEARRLGYGRLVLDTLPGMKAAQGLYRSLGFREIAAYRPSPEGGALSFELCL
jgi:ribosomal protein S18 acetylase RimI-like enzyme